MDEYSDMNKKGVSEGKFHSLEAVKNCLTYNVTSNYSVYMKRSS